MKKFALVCGASGTIGQAIVKELAQSGWSLYLHYDSGKERVQSLVNELTVKYDSQEFIPVQANFQSDEAAQRVASQIFTLHAIVFANGHAVYGLLEDHTHEQMTALWKVHVETPMRITQLLASKLRQQQTSYIIFISSIWGETGASGETVYSAVKGAQNSFVKAYAKEAAYNGIRVNAIAPGIIETEMNNHLDEDEKAMILDEIPLHRYGSPDEVANLTSFAMSGKADYMTGQILRINGGWYI